MPTLFVQYPTGHKTNIDVPPNKPLLKALEIACSKRSLDPTKHIFIHNRRPVDLTAIFRYSGLVNNATVELVQDESKHGAQVDPTAQVRLGFRLEDNQRVCWIGSPSASIWSILTEMAASSQQVTDLLVEDETLGPLGVIYLQEQLIGKASLQATTPADLGVIRGSALLQLHRFPPGHLPTVNSDVVISSAVPHSECEATIPAEADPKPTEMCTDIPNWDTQVDREPIDVPMPEEKPLERDHDACNFVSPFSVFAEPPTQSVFGQPEAPEATQKTKQEPKTLGDMLGVSLDPDRALPHSRPVMDCGPNFTQFKFPEETAGVDLRDRSDDEDLTPSDLQVDRECVPFRFPSARDSSAIDEDLPDDIFEHTEADLRNILRAYHNEWASEGPLQTEAMRKSAREQLYRKYSRAIIQFHFSDEVILQACFHPREHVSDLYHFIQETFQKPQPDLVLYTTPPKVFLKEKNQSLTEANLVPMTKIYVSPHSIKAKEVLKTELISQACPENMQKARDVVARCMQRIQTGSRKTQSSSSSLQQLPLTNHADAENCPTQPKWFKLGK